MDVTLPRELRKHPPRRLYFLTFIRKSHFPVFVFAAFISALSGMAIPLLSWLLGLIFDAFSDFSIGEINSAALKNKLGPYFIYLACLGALTWLLNGIFYATWLVYGEMQSKYAQDTLHMQLLCKPMKWFDSTEEGVLALTSRLQAQFHDLQAATSQPLGLTIQNAASAVSALLLALYVSWDLALVTLSTLPLIVLLLAWTSARIQPEIEKQERYMMTAAKISGNTIRAIDTVACYNSQNAEIQRYLAALKKASEHNAFRASWNATQIASVRLLTLSMFVLGFWYGTRLVFLEKKTAGQVLTAFWACLMATQSAEQVLPLLSVLEKGRAAGANLSSILSDHHNEPTFASRAVESTTFDGDITFDKVFFSYPSSPSRPILQNVDLRFGAGEMTFIVGKTGSGKSSIASLLLRLYEPTSGTINLQDKQLHDIEPRWLRKNFLLIEQYPSLFKGTLLENITLYENLVRRAPNSLDSCIEFSDLKDTILTLPDGLGTTIERGHTSLSGGQCQRLFIARARYRDPQVLILDEATSALDPARKALIFSRLRRWRCNKTTIVITHDVAQITEADYVYVLNEGTVAHQGYWRDLAERNARRDPPSNTDISAPVDRDNVAKDSASVSGPPRRTKHHGSTKYSHKIRASSCSQLSTASTLRMSATRPRGLSSLSEGGSSIELELGELGGEYELALINDGDASPTANRRYSNSWNWPASLGSDSFGKKAARVMQKALTNMQVEATSEVRDIPIKPLKDIFSTIWPQLRMRHRLCVLAGLAGALVHAGATPAFAITFSKLLASFQVSSDQNTEFALRWSLSILGVAATDGVASFFMHYFLDIASEAWVDSLRISALRRTLIQPRKWFDLPENNISELSSSLESCAEDMKDIMGRFAAYLTVAICMTLIASVWSFILCWRLALLGIGIAPLFYAISRCFEVVSSVWERRKVRAGQHLAEMFGETFVKIRTVKVLGLEITFQDRFRRATSTALGVGFKKAASLGILFGFSEASATFVTTLVFWYGSTLVVGGQASVPQITSVFTMLLISLANANANVASIPHLAASKAAAARLLRLVDLPSTNEQEHRGHIRLSRLPGPIEFRGLRFRYPSRPGQEVLSSFTLSIPLKASTGLVGASGSGKSTVLALLLGLYTASPPPGSRSHGVESRLMIGDIPYTACHIPSLRRIIGYVPQQVLLLPTTITENIAYGLEQSSERASWQAVRWAATVSGLDGFVERLADGYDTRIGDGGIGLSGGQTQLLGIARAVVRKPQLVIMDEPTSNLDSASAAEVREAVQALVEMGVTVLMATHNVEMMKAMDRLAVLEGGSIVEEGRWEDLMRRGDSSLRRLVGAEGDVGGL